KRASNSCWKTSTFWLGKAERRNSSRRIRRAVCQCSNLTTCHTCPSRSLSVGTWRDFIPNRTSWGTICANRRKSRGGIVAWNSNYSPRSDVLFRIPVQSFKAVSSNFREYGETQRAVVYQRLERMDRELSSHEFVAGDRFTIADITALVAVDLGGRLADIKIEPELTHLTRWHE